MTLISVNLGIPKVFNYQGKVGRTGIFKEPANRRVLARRNNLEGDEQADLSVHGGPDKAVYAYPSEHYAYWKDLLENFSYNWGAFGENLTTAGMSEEEVCIGNLYRVGSATLMVTQPRRPCSKLAMKFKREDMANLFINSKRSGFYLAVIEEGSIGVADTIEMIKRDQHGVTINEVNQLYLERDNRLLLERVLAVPALSKSERNHFAKRLSS